jgi:multiple sugar transport system substrate-binding protein
MRCRILGTAFLFGLLIIIIGCSTARKDPAGVVRLRFGVLGAKQEADLANALVKGFEAKCRRSGHPGSAGHPNIRINVEPVAGMGYDIKLVMQSAAGTLPDIVWLADSLVPTFTKYQVVRDLRPFIEKDPTFPINDIYPQMLATGMDKQGRIFQLPRELGVVVMFYNRTLFRRAGLPDPPPDWTHGDFLRMAKKLTLRDEQGRVTQYGFSASYTWCGVYAPWVASEGGRVVTADGERAAFSSPRSLEGLKNLIDLVTVEKVAMPPNRSITIPGVDPFAAGKIAMQPQVFPQVPLYRATMKDFDWDVQVMPAGSARHVTNMGAAGYGMSTNTKHPKEAWEFLKYIVSPEGQRILAQAGSGIPCLKSMAKDPVWRRPGKSPRNYDAFINSVEIGMGWDDFLILTRPEVQDAVNQAFEKSFLGKASVEAAFKEADARINKVLRETRD